MDKRKYMILLLFCLFSLAASAQGQRISGTVSDNFGPVMGANVVERDNNNRIISAATTDINGNFSMTVKNTKDKLTISYIGYKTQTLSIGTRTSFKIHMQDNTTIKEVVVKSQKRFNSGGLSIPKKEVSVATQTMNMADVEGLAFTSADEALQGKIAGLDIVANSGNLGSGTKMQLRGVTSINGNTQPLIVVDDQIFDNPDETFDFTTANEEQYAALLSVNPQDIESIDVLKDAAATAIWGARGANGVISIKCKRGARGKARVDYSLRLQGSWQPKGYNLLNGDDYTMLMKEEFYNPSQSATITTNVNELNYNKSWAEYENWNNNTDWVDAVKQFGFSQYHYLTISGGGEKANFRVSAGYDHQRGTIIEQTLNRFSTKLALDYFVSDRITFRLTFPLTYTANNQNYDGLLSKALVMAPNMSIYRQNSDGSDTDEYYIMLPSGETNAAGSSAAGTSSPQLSAVRGIGNPVAIAHNSYIHDKTYRISPEFSIDYDLLGTDNDKTRLKYTAAIYMDIFSESKPSYYDGSLGTYGWTSDSYNLASVYDVNSLAVNVKNQLTFTPKFNNDDIYLTMLGRWQFEKGDKNNQTVTSRLLPNGIESPTVDATLTNMSAGNSEWRWMSLIYSGHFSYKQRYMLGFSIRGDGNTKFGKGKKWGWFPGASLRWNFSDEAFMKGTRKWLSMAALRASWGLVGNAPGNEYLMYSQYSTNGVYGNGTGNMTAYYVTGMQLSDLKWETTQQINLGANLGLFDDMIEADFNWYYKKTSDLLMSGRTIPNAVGFSSLAWKNVGDMTNKGWEFSLNGRNFIKAGKFTVSANFNISQYFNEITRMEQSVLDGINKSWDATDRSSGSYLKRIQVGNPVGSIYGFRYKGVYQYSYDWLIDQQKKNGWDADQFEDYINNTFLASGKTAPIAIDDEGHVLMNGSTPVQMVYNYDNSTGTSTYTFKGGDAIYEDVNHDGQINSLDVVYLGNSNPKFMGGFGFDFRYGQWTLSTSFNFRTGFDVVNYARCSVEKMYTTENQSLATNWRWRKEGDDTYIPRALYQSGYNFQGSDRYVEDGSFLRFNYARLGYRFKEKLIKPIGLRSLTLNLSAQNLFVWSKYSGTDPEHSSGAFGVAMDNSQTPRSKSVTLNINVGF